MTLITPAEVLLPNKRALRTLQHLDAIDIAQIAEPHAVARPVDIVDHDADGRFKADIVADRSDTPDTRGCRCFVAGCRDDQARRQQGQVLDVLDAGISSSNPRFSVVTTIGTFCRLCVRFCAVTTISSTVRGPAS